jgi:hypothetical protein
MRQSAKVPSMEIRRSKRDKAVNVVHSSQQDRFKPQVKSPTKMSEAGVNAKAEMSRPSDTERSGKSGFQLLDGTRGRKAGVEPQEAQISWMITAYETSPPAVDNVRDAPGETRQALKMRQERDFAVCT